MTKIRFDDEFIYIQEIKSASDIAHEKNLTSVGGGNWADKSGEVVARTVDNKLVPVADKEQPQQQEPQKVELPSEVVDKINARNDIKQQSSSEYDIYLEDLQENNIEVIGDNLDQMLDIEDSFETPNILRSFTGVDYQYEGWKLAKLSREVRHPDLETDYRLDKMKEFCNDSPEDQLCENFSPSNKFGDGDKEAFKALQKNQQESLVALGLVNEDGTVTLYRGITSEGDISEGSTIEFDGSPADSWSFSPQSALNFASSRDREEQDDGVKTKPPKVLKVNAPLERVIASFATTEQGGEGMYEWKDELECTLDSVGMEGITAHNPSEGYEKLIEQDGSIVKISINDDTNINWLRQGKKMKNEKKKIEEGIRQTVRGLLMEASFKAPALTKKGKLVWFTNKNNYDKAIKIDQSHTVPTKKQIKQAEKEEKPKKDKGKKSKISTPQEAVDALIDMGYGGDNLIPEHMLKADSSIAEALQKGFHREEGGWQPAPGNAGSLFNETMSMVGLDVINQLEKMGSGTPEPEELLEILNNLYGNTTAWKDVAKKPEQLKIVVAAALQKHQLVKDAINNSSDLDFENSNISSYYGTSISLQNQYEKIMSLGGDDKRVILGGDGEPVTSIPTDVISLKQLLEYNGPDGKKVDKDVIKKMFKNPNSRESVIQFMALSALNGGGGGNPSDTATIIESDSALCFMAYSDKTSLADQQANSTPTQYIETLRETINFMDGMGYKWDPGIVKKIEKKLDLSKEQFIDSERKITEALLAPTRILFKGVIDKKNSAFMVSSFHDQFTNGSGKDSRIIADKVMSINPEENAFGNKKPKEGQDVSWSYYLKEAGWKGKNPPSEEQKIAAYLASKSDPRTMKAKDADGEIIDVTIGENYSSGNDTKYISRMTAVVASGIKEDKVKLDDESSQLIVSQNSVIEKYRKESFDAMTNMFEELNKNQVEDENGERFNVGDMMAGFDLIEKLHLYMVDNKPPGLYSMNSVFLIAGEDGISKENMRECLGADSTEELLKRMRVGPPDKTGETIPFDGEKLYESEISRSGNPDNIAKTKKGKIIYLIDGKYVFQDPKDDPPMNGKKPAKPLGSITGRKWLAYYQDKDGNKVEIGNQVYRTKGQVDKLNTTYGFSKGLQDCLGSKPITGVNEGVEVEGDCVMCTNLNSSVSKMIQESKKLSLVSIFDDINEKPPIDLFLKDLYLGVYKDD